MFLLLAVLPLVSSCGGRQLRTEYARYPESLPGTYTVYLWGSGSPGGPISAVVLDLEGDPYEFYLYTAEFNYSKLTGRSGGQALALALDYLDGFRDTRRVEFREVRDRDGNVIGYDLRPPRYLAHLGGPESLLIYYLEEEKGRIKVLFEVSPAYERSLLSKKVSQKSQ